MTTMHWVDAVISNNATGRCMCGREEGVQYGPSPFGYGNCCIHCQREWERMHDGSRWESNASQLARLRAERSRARADKRDEATVVTAWNQGLPPFERPPKTASISQEWRDAHDTWAVAAGVMR